MSVFTTPASTSAEQAAAYTTAVLDLLGRNHPFDLLDRTVVTLDAVLERLSAELTRRARR